MKYLITGAKGQLGYDIVRELEKRDRFDYLALDSTEMDITDHDKVMQVVTDYKPDVIFHCAAWTAVDKAEEERELCEKVNVLGCANMTEASLAVEAKIFYMSTDYVFDGKKDGEYLPEDAVNPCSVYGMTKYQGEEEVRRNPKHYITRISWVFGINGKNFVKTMLQLAENHSVLNVVDDQIGSPTYTVDLAKILVDMSDEEKYGTYHITNDGYCSWADFAEYIFKTNHKEVKVNRVSTEEYLSLTGTKQAYRPKNSKLNKEKLIKCGFRMLPSWQDAINRYNIELEEKEK